MSINYCQLKIKLLYGNFRIVGRKNCLIESVITCHYKFEWMISVIKIERKMQTITLHYIWNEMTFLLIQWISGLHKDIMMNGKEIIK